MVNGECFYQKYEVNGYHTASKVTKMAFIWVRVGCKKVSQLLATI